MSKPLVIFGAGSMARVLLSFLEHGSVAAFVVDDEFQSGALRGLPVVRLSDAPNFLAPDRYDFLMAIGYAGMNEGRRARFELMRDRGYGATSYVHDSVIEHDGAHVCSWAVIYDGVALHADAKVDLNAFISSNVSIGHDCQIGHSAWLNSGVSLGGGVKVGDGCVLGMNAVVAEGVTLGARTFVGANTLVTRDTMCDSVVVSEPGRRVAVDSRRFLQLTKASK